MSNKNLSQIIHLTFGVNAKSTIPLTTATKAFLKYGSFFIFQL